MRDAVIDIIESFKYYKVLVIGDAIADVYINATPGKICSEAPVLVFNVVDKEYRCGGAANVAVNTSLLGAETFFLTVTGDDADAAELIRELNKCKVNSSYVIKDKRRTT